MKQIHQKSTKSNSASNGSKKHSGNLPGSIGAEIKKNLSKQTDELHDLVSKQAVVLKENAGKLVKWSIRKTHALTFYLVKLAFRFLVFCTVFGFYLFDRDELTRIVNQPFLYEITPLHLIWAFFMLIMLTHLIPNNRLTMAWQKARETVYRPVNNYDEKKMYRFAQLQNISAWKVMLVWLSFNAIFGVLYLLGIIQSGDLLMLSVLYFLFDYICILFFCPFQTFIMKNKCCINYRIYDWGHFMMFTPMLFIKNFFSWSLFFTSIIVLIHWEVSYSKHPERYWEGSNLTLQCSHCKEQTCQIKRKIARKQSPFISSGPDRTA